MSGTQSELGNVRRWHGYALTQILALLSASYVASEAYDGPMYASHFGMGLALALFATVPAALVFGIAKVLAAGGVPRTRERAQWACAASVLFVMIVASIAAGPQDVGDLTPREPRPNPPSQWIGALAGMEVGLAFRAATGALVSVGMPPSLKNR